MSCGGSTIPVSRMKLAAASDFPQDWILVQLCNVRLNMMSSFIIFCTHVMPSENFYESSAAPPQRYLQTNKQKSSPHQKKPSAIAVTIVDFQICQTDVPKVIPFLRLLEATGDMISPTQPKHWGEIPSKHTWLPPIFSPTVPGTFESMIFLFPSWDMFFFLRRVIYSNDPWATLTYKPLLIKVPLCWRHLKGSAAIRLYIQGATSLP